jgi:hypothetical protein
LKAKARSVGLSMSELIRRTLEKDLERDPAMEARTFFQNLKPLESFANTNSQAYVRSLRNKSRTLRTDASK